MKASFLKYNDQITFNYQIYFYNEQKQLKLDQNNDQQITITLGKNQWLKGIDQFLINKPINQAGLMIIDHFLVNDPDHHLNQKWLYIEVNLKAYQKPKQKQLIIRGVQSLKTETETLKLHLSKVEEQLKNNLSAFQAKQNELQTKFVSEIEKIKADLKTQSTNELEQQKQFLQTKLFSELINPLSTFKQIIDYCQDQQQFANFVKSFAMLNDQLWTILNQYGLKPIPVAIGDQFDATYHQLNQLLESQSENDRDQSVIKVVANGYQLYDRVLKPAIVDVIKKDQN